TAMGLVRKETSGEVGRGEAFGDLGAAATLEAAFAMEPSTLSEPLRIDSGWAVVRVSEKKAFDPAAFAKEQQTLASSLREDRRQKLFASYMTGARERFEVLRYPDAIQKVVG